MAGSYQSNSTIKKNNIADTLSNQDMLGQKRLEDRISAKALYQLGELRCTRMFTRVLWFCLLLLSLKNEAWNHKRFCKKQKMFCTSFRPCKPITTAFCFLASEFKWSWGGKMEYPIISKDAHYLACSWRQPYKKRNIPGIQKRESIVTKGNVHFQTIQSVLACI